jgi:predicted NBD/HSP70 family sugar kinase
VEELAVWTAPPSPRRCWRWTRGPARCWPAARRRTRASAGAGRETDPEAWWQALLTALGRLGECRGPALRAAAAEGGPAALRALAEAGTALGIALSGAVNLLDPQAVVVGGPLAELADRVTDRRRRPEDVVTSRLGSDGVLRGAAYSAVRAVLDDPAHWIQKDQRTEPADV